MFSLLLSSNLGIVLLLVPNWRVSRGRMIFQRGFLKADRYQWSDMGPLEMAEHTWVIGVVINPYKWSYLNPPPLPRSEHLRWKCSPNQATA